MFHIVILVVFILNQVYLCNARDCSPVACPKEACNITRKVPLDQGSILWERNNQFALLSNHPCTSPSPNGNYSGYCFDDSTSRTYVLEIRHPEFHDQSDFTDNIISVTTTMEVMEPDNLSSDNVTINATNTTTGDILHVLVRVSCNKPEPTFTWNFNASKTTIPYTIVRTQTLSDNTGCKGSLLNRMSSLSFNLKDWDPEITKADGDIDISVDVKFGECTVSSSPVTVKYIAPGTSSVSPETTMDTTNGLLPGLHECHCYCLVLLIIKVVLVVVTIILVIVHFCRREAKPDGNVYWVITVGFILDGPVCFVLSIIQILYFEHIIACSQCMDKPGYDAAIAFDVCGFITSIVCIVFFWIRLKQRDQSKKVPVSTTEMNLNTEKEGNGTRPLPTPKNT